ncbi:DUF2075 domain-containing protein [Pollutibacter soli]|uniref:DUF2075 domain-containing protein n=1 Tax=Pollutibacter soli TaxID=3034157 RepID=UPI00301377F7
MIVYKNTAKGFITDVETNKISSRIKESVINAFGWNKIKANEEASWTNSMQFMGNVIRRAAIADDCGVLIEYNLPSTSLRVDFIVTGHDETGKPSFIIIELKQWTSASSTMKDGIVHTDYYGNTTHPSYQAYSYKLYLKDYNESIYNSSIQAFSCAYLHNYTEKRPEPLKAEIYSSIIKEAPIYFRDDQLQLEEFLKIYVGKGKGEDILYRIENGNIRPSKKLIDHVTGLIEGNAEFTLLDEQKLAFESAKELALSGSGKKVIIINGGPGTGKSVISMNLLGSLLKHNKNAIFVAPNAAFREVMLSRLTENKNTSRVKHLLKGSAAFYASKKNTFDVIVVDEAHRLKNENAFMYKGKNQVEDIVNAARVSIFFVDEKQIIRPDDIGTLAEIKRVAALHQAEVSEFNLKAQFRCSGAEGFINWVDDVLDIDQTANYDGWDGDDFEFRIVDDPNALKSEIDKKAQEGYKARMLAGYAWEWTPANQGNANAQVEDVKIPEHQFQMPWNSRSVGTTWAVDAEGVDQIGCVHTSQGLEFDYVGIIIGKDLRYDAATRKYFTVWNDYKDAKGKQGLSKRPEDLNKLVRQIYRILFTRGMKGCYVYFMNKEAEEVFKTRLNHSKS